MILQTIVNASSTSSLHLGKSNGYKDQALSCHYHMDTMDKDRNIRLAEWRDTYSFAMKIRESSQLQTS